MTIIPSGQEWPNAARVNISFPDPSGKPDGEVLTTESGAAVWAPNSGGDLPDPSGKPDGDVLTTASGVAVWAAGGGSEPFNGGTITNPLSIEVVEGSGDEVLLSLTPSVDQEGSGGTLFVITGLGEPGDNFGLFEITEDGRMLGGGNGASPAYEWQFNQGQLTLGGSTSGGLLVQGRAGTFMRPLEIQARTALGAALATLFMLEDGTLAYYDTNGTSAFEVRPDGTVHIKTGTSIVADL